MNFERGKDVKDSIGIGAKQTAREVYAVGYYEWKSFTKSSGKKINMKACQQLSESHCIRALMGISEGKLKVENYGLKEFENGRLSKWGNLKWFRGKWLKYRNHFYYIPE